MPSLNSLLEYVHNRPPELLPQIHAVLTTSGFLLPSSLPRGSSVTFAYNCLIRGWLRRGDRSDACLRLLVQMLAHGVPPNSHTFPSLVKAAAAAFCPYSGRALHAQIFRRGLILDGFTNCSIVDLYAGFGDLSSARKMFDALPQPDLASRNSMLHALCLHGDLVSALGLFESMIDRDVISWTSLINGYARSSGFHEAVELFRKWILQKDVPIRPNEAMLVSVLSACANLDSIGSLFSGMEIHGYIIRNEAPLTAFIATALIDMYGKLGLLSYCKNVFEATSEKEMCTWNAMISAFANNGKAVEALNLFEEMRTLCLQPNHITFVGVLTACARHKLVDVGLVWFEAMSSKFGLVPLMEHYGCVVDLLAKAGFFKEAISFIRRMPFEPDASVWGALLGACMFHENAELGDDVGKQLIMLQPWHSGRYMVLRNIYAGVGRWGDAAGLKDALEKSGIRKPTGYSLMVSGKYVGK